MKQYKIIEFRSLCRIGYVYADDEEQAQDLFYDLPAEELDIDVMDSAIEFVEQIGGDDA